MSSAGRRRTRQARHLLLLAGDHLVVVKLDPLAILLRGGEAEKGTAWRG